MSGWAEFKWRRSNSPLRIDWETEASADQGMSARIGPLHTTERQAILLRHSCLPVLGSAPMAYCAILPNRGSHGKIPAWFCV